jgi:NAD-dependent SIR2 family protein deacetylase
MSSARKRKKKLQANFSIDCSGCGSRCHLLLDDDVKKDIYSIECEQFSYVVCQLCTPAVEVMEKMDGPNGLAVYASYINPSIVQHCNRTDIIKISSYMNSAIICLNYASKNPNGREFKCEIHDDGAISKIRLDSLRDVVPDLGDCNYNLDLGISLAKSWFFIADAVLIIAGAGMSADSGLATFRYELSDDSGQCGTMKSISGPDLENTAGSPTDIVTLLDPTAATREGPLLGGGLSVTEVCYQTRPEKAWYYDASIRRDSFRSAPHSGYYIMHNALTEFKKDFFVLTSNIDNYFTRAKYCTDRIYECHGSIDRVQCGKLTSDGRCEGAWRWTDIPSYASVGPVLDDVLLECDLRTTPRCPSCGGVSRANISHVTDDPLDLDSSVKGSQKERFWAWLRQFRSGKYTEEERGGKDRKRTKKNTPLSSTAAANQSLKLNPESSETAVKQGHKKLLIIEIGCGGSIHGLRLESEVLLSAHPDSGVTHSKLIRINPDLKSCTRGPKKGSRGRAEGAQEGEASSSIVSKNQFDTVNATDDWYGDSRTLELSCSALDAIERIFGGRGVSAANLDRPP